MPVVHSLQGLLVAPHLLSPRTKTLDCIEKDLEVFGFVSNSTEIANVDSNGITSTQFIGGGANITGIAAGNIASGTIATARIPTLNQDTTGNAASADTIDVTGSGTDSSFALTFVASTGSAKTLLADTSGILFNPHSNTLTTGTFNGSGASLTNLNAGNISSGTIASARVPTLNQDTTGTAAIATTITVADESSDTGCFVLFSTSASGNLAPKSGSNLTFNSSSGLLTATSLAGTLTTAAQGNVTSLGSLTGLTVDGDVTLTGASQNIVFDKSDNALEFADGAMSKFGTDGDIEIYHSGNSFIRNVNNSVDFRIVSNSIELKSYSGDEYFIKCTVDSDVEIYHDNTKVLETYTGGISLLKGAKAAITALSLSGSTLTVNAALSSHFSFTLTSNITINFSNSSITIGQSGSIFLTQDGTGSRTAAFSSAFKFPGGTAPTLSTAANAVDRIDYVVLADSKVHAVASLDVK